MIELVHETVIEYRLEDYEKWSGCKLIQEGLDIFCLHVALNTYKAMGWKGTQFYTFNERENLSQMRRDGIAILDRVIEKKLLSILRGFRYGLNEGEPELFLYKDDGSFMFVKVNHGNQKINEAHMVCLSQIKSILECEVVVAHIKQQEQGYMPVQHEIDYIEFPWRWYL